MYPNQTTAASTLNPPPPFSGNAGGNAPSISRDPGALGMAANRVRGINQALERIIGRVSYNAARIAEHPQGNVGEKVPSPPPPSATVPGLDRELSVAETLTAQLDMALTFLDSL